MTTQGDSAHAPVAPGGGFRDRATGTPQPCTRSPRDPVPPTPQRVPAFDIGGRRERNTMPVEARRLQDWIGTEVLDSSGEKLGKLEDVYFRDGDALAVSIRSGLAGRKHHAAALRGATVGRDSLQLDATAETIVATDGKGLGAEQLTMLAALDDRLHGLGPDEIEGWNAREERLEAQAEAQANADKLRAEAQRRAQEEDQAAAKAREADEDATEARRARQDAEAHAQLAREEAERPG
jgi:hypothetical protein